MPEREAALARGFVLGEDDRIDGRTRDDFQRSNLTHLLAVSGENVILLGVLAWPLLALVGLPLRARLIGTLCLIAIYVPVTGAGPSIQRAGVMGAAGLIAALADRPRSRWYAVLLAAAATLAVDPRADGDVGWQLSFAAVIGIMLWAKRLAAVLSGDVERRSARHALAEAIAVTASATVATAPLMAAGLRAVLAGRPARERPGSPGGCARDVARDADGDRRPGAFVCPSRLSIGSTRSASRTSLRSRTGSPHPTGRCSRSTSAPSGRSRARTQCCYWPWSACFAGFELGPGRGKSVSSPP